MQNLTQEVKFKVFGYWRNPLPINRNDIYVSKQKLAFTLDNVFSKIECELLNKTVSKKHL